LTLYSPALDWILQNFTNYADDEQLRDLIAQCMNKKNGAMLFLSLLHSLQPEFVTSRAIEFVKYISDTNNEGVTKAALLRQLGNIVSLFPPVAEHRSNLLNETWKIVNTITNSDDYISCVELWSQFIAANFDSASINNFFDGILNRISSNRTFERYYNELQGILDKIVCNVTDFHGLLIVVTLVNF
jgi:hypothetical protein